MTKTQLKVHHCLSTKPAASSFAPSPLWGCVVISQSCPSVHLWTVPASARILLSPGILASPCHWQPPSVNPASIAGPIHLLSMPLGVTRQHSWLFRLLSFIFFKLFSSEAKGKKEEWLQLEKPLSFHLFCILASHIRFLIFLKDFYCFKNNFKMTDVDKNPNSLLCYLRYSVIYFIFISWIDFPMYPLHSSQTTLLVFSNCVRLTLHSTAVFTPECLGGLDPSPGSTSYQIYRLLTLLSLGSCNCEGGIWLFFPHTGMRVIKTFEWSASGGKKKCV